MTSETDFRALLAANPADATTRLVFADWLGDQGRYREAAIQRVLAAPDNDAMRLEYADVCALEMDTARAEFVRVQVDLAKWPGCGYSKLDTCLDRRRDVQDVLETGCLFCRQWVHTQLRDRELWHTATHNQWFDVGILSGGPTWWSPKPGVVIWRHFNGGMHALHVARGFVDSVTCSWADWCQHGDRICEEQPVRKVVLTTRPTIGDSGEGMALPGQIVTLGLNAPGPPYDLAFRVAGKVTVIPEREWVTISGALDDNAALLTSILLRPRWPTVATFEMSA